MTSHKRPRFLLVVSIDLDSLSRLPKMFHDAGAQVWVVAPQGFRMARSRYVTRHIVADNHWSSVLQLARETVESEHFDGVVMTSDKLMYEIYLSDDKRWIERYLPVAPCAAGSLIASKNAFLQGCAGAGIRVPRFEICTTLDEALAAAERIGYPVMLKLDQGAAGTGVRRVQDEAEVRALYAERFVHRYEDRPSHGALAVQQLIDGRAGTTAVLFQNGKPVYTVSAYYERCWPTPFSPPTVRRFVNAPVFYENACRVGSLLQYNGIGGIDWMEDRKTGRVYVLEVNPRPMPMHLIAPALPNFARAMRAMVNGEPIPALKQAGRSGSIYRAFPMDLYRVLAHRDVKEVLRWIVTMPFARSVPSGRPTAIITAAFRGGEILQGPIGRYYLARRLATEAPLRQIVSTGCLVDAQSGYS